MRQDNLFLNLAAGNPRLLLEGWYVHSAVRTNYDVTADGQRFVMVQVSGQQEGATQINVVLNWFEGLKRRVPTGND